MRPLFDFVYDAFQSADQSGSKWQCPYMVMDVHEPPVSLPLPSSPLLLFFFFSVSRSDRENFLIREVAVVPVENTRRRRDRSQNESKAQREKREARKKEKETQKESKSKRKRNKKYQGKRKKENGKKENFFLPNFVLEAKRE